MKRLARYRILAIALSVILAQAAPAIGQTSTTTKKPADETIKGYTVEKKNEAVAYGKKLVSDLDVQIKNLEKQVGSDTSAAAADAKRQGQDIKKELADLKAARAKTGKHLDEMGKASAESWDGMKQAFADSYKDLQKAYDAAVAKVKK